MVLTSIPSSSSLPLHISAGNANCVIKCSLNDHLNQVRMAYFNSRSINMQCKFAEILRLVDGLNFNFIAVSETWLKPWVSSKSVEIPGYTIIRNDRPSHAGGVALYVHNNIKWKVIDRSNGNLTEFLFIEVHIDNNKMLIGVVYNSAGGNVDYLEEIFSIHSVNYEHILIAGDFNINMVSRDPAAIRFKNVLRSQNLSHFPYDQPTHFSHVYQSSSLIDIFITTSADRIAKFGQLDVSFLDHDFLYVAYSMPNPLPPIESFHYRSYKHVDMDALLAECLGLQWEAVFDTTNINSKISILNKFILFLYNKYVPLKLFKKRSLTTPSWFNCDIVNAINIRELSYSTWKKNKTDENRQNFIICRRIVKQLIKKAKAQYIYNKLDPKLPIRNLWNNIRNLGLTNSMAPTPKFSAEEINMFFTRPIPLTGNLTGNHNQYILPNINPHAKQEFYFHTVSELTILRAFKSIKSNSIGDDGIPLRFLKLLLPTLIPVITHILNLCLSESVFPTLWKVSQVVPIPKVQQPKLLKDLRPISILCVFSKVLERIMSDQINSFLETHNMIDTFQSGFRAKHSTVSALLKITDDLSYAMDNNLCSILVLLDLSRAFDLVSHSILLKKLKHMYGFSSTAITMLRNYLVGRTQYVKFNSELSAPILNACGVPQGSVLGPLLFLLFINDVSASIQHCQYHLYADDLQIYLSGTIENISAMALKINADLSSILSWANCNNLAINYHKTQAITFHKCTITSNIPSVMIEGQPIPFVDKIRNLGILLNSNLSWDDHVGHICCNIYIGLKRLSKFKSSTPFKTRKGLAMTLLFSQIIYADILLANLNYELKHRLQVAFNSITRYVFNLHRYDHITPYSKQLLGCSFGNYLKFRQCTFLFKVIHHLSPTYLTEKIQLSRSSRNLCIIIPKHKSMLRANSFLVSGAQTWNGLPLDLKRISQLTQFKTSCFNHFASQ